MAAPARVFLGYHRPPLEPVAAWLIDHAGGHAEVDLGGTFVCVSGSRAARQLLALLVERCQEEKLLLTPPRIGTPMALLDALLPAPALADIAAQTDRLLAWSEAVGKLSPEELRTIVPLRRTSDPADFAFRMGVARLFDDARRELSGTGITLAESRDLLLQKLPDLPDSDRWEVIARAEDLFLRLLAERGLVDETQTRADMFRSRRVDRGTKVILAALPEIPPFLRKVLGAHPPSHVLVVADAGEAGYFDEFGCVRPEAFPVTDLRPEHLNVGDSPASQAGAVISFLRSLPPGTPVDDVLVGVPDATVAPAVRAGLEDVGVLVRDAAGRKALSTGPFLFLRCVAQYLEAPDSRTLSAVVRHPDVFDAISGELGASPNDGSWLRELDESLVDRLDPAVSDAPDAPPQLRRVITALRGLLGELLDADPVASPLTRWTGAIRSALARVYSSKMIGGEGSETHTSYRACEVLSAGLDELELAASRASATTCSPAQAVRLLIQLGCAESIPERANPGAIELVGWLEAAFDDASACVITGLNEGVVPRRPAVGGLMTGASRRALGLDVTGLGLARDAYLLNVFLRCHDRVAITLGRRSASGDPLLPSRLVFTCCDAELPERVGLWRPATTKATPNTPTPSTGASGFQALPRVAHRPVTSMPVTAFRTFLASPYEFFLRHVLRLEDIGDLPHELGPDGAGTLVHRALKLFAAGAERDSASVGAITRALSDALDHATRELFGPTPAPIVLAQLVQVRARLGSFAEFQAQRRAEGWRILHTEWSPRAAAAIDAPGGPMPLRGTIDRVDRHDATGRLAILDYKTGANPKKPEASHRSAERWTDLQLPLYRHLAAELWRHDHHPADPDLALVCIPVKPGPAELNAATWTPEELVGADDAAREVIARVRAGDFFRAGDDPPASGVFGLLCGQGVIVNGRDGDPEEQVDP